MPIVYSVLVSRYSYISYHGFRWYFIFYINLIGLLINEKSHSPQQGFVRTVVVFCSKSSSLAVSFSIDRQRLQLTGNIENKFIKLFKTHHGFLYKLFALYLMYKVFTIRHLVQRMFSEQCFRYLGLPHRIVDTLALVTTPSATSGF